MSIEPIKVAVVGAGAMGSNHIRVLSEFDEEKVRLVGVADTVEASVTRVINRFHVPGFADYREMIETTHPDLLVIVTPTNLHHEVAAFAIGAGCNTLVEKPIASTIEEAEDMVRLAEERHVILAVGHVERFNPAVQTLKQNLDQLGKLFHLHARRIGPYPPRIRDVGVILDLATHDLDAMLYLTNAAIEHVYAETQQVVLQQPHEDLLLGLLRFDSGVIGMLDVNWLTPTKVRELHVTGERGLFMVNYLTQDLYFYENDYAPTNWEMIGSLAGVSEGTMTRLKVRKAEPLRLEYEDIFRAITEKVPPTVTGKDGLAVLRVAYQILEASQTGKVVTCTTGVMAR
jgi:UDP-N-acetylglucosamine 3-dehydrogenase